MRALTLAFALLAALPAAAAPRVEAASAARLRDARAQLDAALGALKIRADAASLRRARQAMAAIDRALDAYFHAPNLRDPSARPAVLALRPRIHALYRGPDAPMALVDDVLRFRPSIHVALADAAAALGRHAEAWRHLKAARAAGGDPAALDARLAAACAAGGPSGCAIREDAPARP
ncbi:MAG: hypothetical protein H6704_19220 [Myxococcales bacterium]|nr:hypothetical protein [Myxococcales bacterium]